MKDDDRAEGTCVICGLWTSPDAPYTTCYPCTFLLGTYRMALMAGKLTGNRARLRHGRLTRTSAPWPTRAPSTLRDVFQGVAP